MLSGHKNDNDQLAQMQMQQSNNGIVEKYPDTPDLD